MEISLNLLQECNREILYSSLNSKEVVATDQVGTRQFVECMAI